MNLLMLTKFYPFGTGEAFIENEIRVFSECYKNITIIACEVPKNVTAIREVPNNVTAYRIDAQNKLQDVLKGVTKNFLFRSTEFRNELKHCKGIKQILFLSYFEEKSNRVFNEIINKGLVDDTVNQSFDLYSYWLFMTARVGTLISGMYKPNKMFSRTHGYDLYAYRNSLRYLPYRRFFLDRYNYVFPCSEDGTNYLNRLYPEFKSKIKTSFLGTLDYGTGLSSDDGVFRIVSCSRVTSVKRVDSLASTLKKMDANFKNIEWHHIGDGEELSKIKSLCDGFKNIKAIFHGNMSNSDVLKFYQRNPIDLFINVSSSEGLPVSIMEAISFGIPVVATDVGGTSEIVINGISGVLIPKLFTDDELIDEIIRFINMSKKEYQTLRDCARKLWEENFRAEVNYTSLCELLKK